MQNIGHASPQAWPSVIASCTSGMCLHMLPVEMMASTLKQTLFFFFLPPTFVLWPQCPIQKAEAEENNASKSLVLQNCSHATLLQADQCQGSVHAFLIHMALI